MTLNEIATYIWLDSVGQFRHKIKTIEVGADGPIFPVWNYDGSSTGQRTTANSEVRIHPVLTIKAPTCLALGTRHHLVLCSSKFREQYNELFQQAEPHEVMFGFELEFFLFDRATNKALGSPKDHILSQGTHYCGLDSHVEPKTQLILEQIYHACLQVGLPVSGCNVEVAPGQVEIQLCSKGLKACDQFMLMRYLIERIANRHNCYPVFTPKPYRVLNGSGCHINCSSAKMRGASTNNEFFELATKVFVELERTHTESLKRYGGADNTQTRLTGTCETSSADSFSWGKGSRASSVRVAYDPVGDDRRYFEDRRPGANINPYMACSVLLEAIIEANA